MADPSTAGATPAAGGGFYDVLGVEKTATQEEIKQAFRKLALQHHPDRAGPEGAERMKAVNGAYAVLSDPQKRTAYDRFGQRGVDAMDHGLASPVAGVGLHVLFLVLALSILLTVICSFATFIQIAQQVDGGYKSSWGATLAPLYVLVGIVLLAGVLYFFLSLKTYCSQEKETAPQPQPRDGDQTTPDPPAASNGRVTWKNFAAVVVLLFACLTPIFVGYNLDNPGAMTWMVAFGPYITCLVGVLIVTLTSINVEATKEALHRQGLAEVSRFHAIVVTLESPISKFMNLLFFVLLAIWLDRPGGGGYSVWSVCAPLYIDMAIQMLKAAMVAHLTTVNGMTNFTGAFCSWLSAISGISMYLATVIMVDQKVSGALDRSLMTCFIPVLILQGFALLACILGVCCIGANFSELGGRKGSE